MDDHTHPEISGLDGRISSVEASVFQLRERVDGLEKNVVRAVNEVQRTVNEFVTEYRRDRIVQSANNDLVEARRELSEEFGRYKEVRDLASEIIYVVQNGSISRAVIVDVTERLAIRTPQYWLAPAVLAVAAWLDHDKERYAESIAAALSLDHSKTSLFMTLLLRHQARTGDMREWIGAYLAGLEPTNLPTDFTVVIEAVAGRTLGADSAPHLARRMRSWYDNAASSHDAWAEEIDQWERNLLGLAAAGDYDNKFPVLAGSSPTWNRLRKRHEAFTAIEAADRYFRDRFAEGVDVPADLDGKISLLLKSLAADPDPAEEQIQQRVRRAEAVIETQDQAAAERRVAAEEADRARTLNILSLVTRAAFPTGRRRPPTMTELLAIVMSQRLISASAENVYEKHEPPTVVDINIRSRHCAFHCSSDQETTPEALRLQADEMANQFADRIDSVTSQQQNELRRGSTQRMTVMAVIAAVILVVAIIFGIAGVAGIILIPLAALTLLYGGLHRFVRLQGRMNTLLYNGNQEKNELRDKLYQAADELASLFAQEKRSRDVLPQMQDYLLELTADDAYQAIRGTAPARSVTILPRQAEHDTIGSPIADETDGNGLAHGFPEWTPRPPTRPRPPSGRLMPPA